MIDLFKNVFRYILFPIMKYVPGVQEAYDEAVDHRLRLLLGRCLFLMSSGLFFIPDDLKTQDMWNEEVNIEPRSLALVSDCVKTQEMCNKAARRDPWLLNHVPDWFVTQQQLKIWHDDDYDDGHIEWYEGYKKRRAEKDQIEKELMPIAWHPSRW